MRLTEGMLVRHESLGPGKVIRVGGAFAHVFFVDQSGNDARRFPAEGAPLRPLETPAHPWLDNLPPFDDVGGRLRLSENRITHAQAIEKFRRLFPDGFSDNAYLGDATVGERRYKWEKHEEYLELLGGGRGEALLAEGNLAELIRCVRRITSTNMTSIYEKGAFGEALVEGAEAHRYFETLFTMLASPVGETTFDAYVDALDSLPRTRGRVATWPIATLLPFLAQPDRHMFLKPEVTQETEARLAYDLAYDSHPNWRTYRKLLELTALLMEDLRSLGAQDNIDVQSFMWVASKYGD